MPRDPHPGKRAFGAALGLGVGLVLGLAPLSAPAQDLRPVPDYFAEAIFASTMARSLTEFCGGIVLDKAEMAARRSALEAQLVADGFDPARAMEQMEDPTGQVHAIQAKFLEKYQLESATQTQVCMAAFSEIDNETLIGSLLQEISQ